MTFLAEGAKRNSRRWDLYSRLVEAGFLRANGMYSLRDRHVRQFAVPGKNRLGAVILSPPAAGGQGGCFVAPGPTVSRSASPLPSSPATFSLFRLKTERRLRELE